ncbi:DUF397 domain-containing protein [Micromonospora chokoriensis]|uniref:DUF397 domain-containing protein n=1 Tax=Micromonospora chokoriensis TaxID=356851 RepID=A0A1C4UDD7_9ACTN|nr:DUF397 domain-containing protein [Micromonospora chokoriensis]SCE69662.1 protein of unknown function [Micromonospora chokoriensis]
MTPLSVTWRTSTRSGTQGQCVEVRYVEGRVEVRDSKDQDGPALAFPAVIWSKFVGSAGAHRTNA